MSHQFEVGDRVRTTVERVGAPRGSTGVVVEPAIHATYFGPSGWTQREGGGYVAVDHGLLTRLYAPDELELITPEAPASPSAPTSTFELYGFGLQDLMALVDAFQVLGESKFDVQWSLTGRSNTTA